MKTTASPYLPMQVALFDDMPQTVTRERGLAMMKACALLRIPFRYRQVSDEPTGWQTLKEDSMQMVHLRHAGILHDERGELERREICELVCQECEVKADNMLADFPFKVSITYRDEHQEASVQVDNLSICPEVTGAAFGRAVVKWHVMSIDIDDQQDEFVQMEKAIVCAASRATERKLLGY
jgi:hypothetical protein